MHNSQILLCILFLIIVFYGIFITIKLFITSKKLSNTTYRLANITTLYDDVKSFKHDFENMVSVIGGFINKTTNIIKIYLMIAKN